MSRVEGYGPLNQFKDYVVQKQWVAVAMLVTSVVLFSSTAVFGGLHLWSNIHLMNSAAAWAIFGSGTALAVTGTLLAIVLLSNQGRSPLHRAIRKGKSLDGLLTQKNVNKPDHQGHTPLHYAVAHGYGLDQLLAQPDIQVNAENDFDATPLVIAVRTGNLERINTLLNHPKIRVDAESLQLAISHDKTLILQNLLDHPIEDGTRRAALLHAAQEGKLDGLRALLEKYEDANHEDLQDALVTAAYFFGHNQIAYEGIIDALLQKGVDVNAPSKLFKGRNALHQAAYRGYTKLVRKLLQNTDIYIDAKDNEGHTALALADTNSTTLIIRWQANQDNK